MKVKIEISDEVVEHLNQYPGTLKEMIEYIINRDYKMKHHVKKGMERFDNTTKDGILTRVYYYQKKKYDRDLNKGEFFSKWKNDKNFNYIFKQYKKSGYDKNYMPVFIRSVRTGELIVAPNMERKYFKRDIIEEEV